MKWMVDARAIMLVGLLGATSLLLAFGSSIAWIKANQREREASQVIQRADSLQRDWVRRGCAPRTQALP